MLFLPGEEEDGQSLAEYAVVLGFVSVVVVAALTAIGGAVQALYSSVVSQFPH